MSTHAADPALGPFHYTTFYVPGRYVTDDDGSRMVDQMYVERLHRPKQPGEVLPKLVLVHGGGLSGASFGTTPDGRPGWRDHFAAQGYDVYVIDQATRGRSGHHVVRQPIGASRTAEWVAEQYTASESLAPWPSASRHTQWPGSGLKGDPLFDQMYAAAVPYFTSNSITESLGVEAIGRLLDQIGPASLLTHSKGGPVGWRVADAKPDLVEAIIAVEPSGPPGVGPCPVEHPDFTGGAIAFAFGVCKGELAYASAPECRGNHGSDNAAPCPPPRLVNLAEKPVLVVTGEASYHAQYDHLTVEFLRQAGVASEHMPLESVGLPGNGHMMMLELNSAEIATQLVAWLEKQGISASTAG